MPITIDLPPELEKQLRENASAVGIAAEDFVMDALEERLEKARFRSAQQSHLSHDESWLLQEINRGLSEESWRRYRELKAIRDAGALTEAEHAELKSLTDDVELAHSERLKKLVNLAHLRRVSVDALMEELGIRDPGYV